MYIKLDHCILIAFHIIQAVVKAVSEDSNKYGHISITEISFSHEDMTESGTVKIEFSGDIESAKSRCSDLNGFIQMERNPIRGRWFGGEISGKVSCLSWNWTVKTVSTQGQGVELHISGGYDSNHLILKQLDF